MKNSQLLPTSLLAMIALAGCATVKDNSALNQARGDYNAAQNNPQVVALAPIELKQAGDALLRANNAASEKEKAEVVTHLAYLAKQRTAIAWEASKLKAAEKTVAGAEAERNKIRLEARTDEANKAQLSAAESQRQADASQLNAEASQRQSEAAQQIAATSQRQTEAAQQDAAVSQQQLEASQKNAAALQQKSEASEQLTREAEMRTSQAEAQLKELNAKKTDRGLVITLGDVLFDTNKSELKSGGTNSLQKLAGFLKQYPERQVQVEGYTDSTGSVEHNQALSDRRAIAVRSSLVGMGVSGDRIVTHGYGQESPVAGNNTAAGRQMNRRVEIVVSEEKSSNVSTR